MKKEHDHHFRGYFSTEPSFEKGQKSLVSPPRQRLVLTKGPSFFGESSVKRSAVWPYFPGKS